MSDQSHLYLQGLLTYHPVENSNIKYDWNDPYWNKITQNFGNEIAGDFVVATDILMARKQC